MLTVAQFVLRYMNKPNQVETTLKWSSDGDLSSIDMARILQLLADKELIQCVLSCDAKNKSSEILFYLKDY